VLVRDHTLSPATHTNIIHKCNEPYLQLLPSCRPSLHFGWYTFTVPPRVGGWVGLGGLMSKYCRCCFHYHYVKVLASLTVILHKYCQHSISIHIDIDINKYDWVQNSIHQQTKLFHLNRMYSKCWHAKLRIPTKYMASQWAVHQAKHIILTYYKIAV